MPKKSSKLSELFLEIDKDQLCDILLNIAESSPEIDNRIRTLITPKSQLNNPIAFYKKLANKLPNRINNASDRKLLLEALKPILTQVKDLQNIRNYLEASKPLFVILETMLLKLAKSDLKGMLIEMQKATIAWCENIDKIPNSEVQFMALQDILGLENAKELQLERQIMGYKVTREGPIPVYHSSTGLHTDFYQLLLQLSKSIESKSLLEDLRKYLTSHQSSKQFDLQLLNISQKLDSEEDFVKSIIKDLKNRESAILLKDFYWNKGEYSKAADILFQHIDLNKDYFGYKNGEEYASTLHYVAIYNKNPEYCKPENYCQVLVYLVATGDSNTAQDVSITAKWRGFFKELVDLSGVNFDFYYKQIVSRLSTKYLNKILAEIALIMEDKIILAMNIGYLEFWEDTVQACEIITKQYPEHALKSISKLIRSDLSEFDYHHYGGGEDFKSVFKQDRIVKLLNNIKTCVTEDSHKKIDNMITKVNKCYKAFEK